MGRSPARAPAVPGGWVAALGDCLEERAAGRFTVVDRARPAETAVSARERVADVRAMQPALVVVGVGAQEIAVEDAQPASFKAEVESLVGALRAEPAPDVLLVGIVPPAVAKGGAKAQARIDERTATWNAELAQVASATEGVDWLDLQADWPTATAERSALTVDAARLSDQGHARVAAAVCDAVLAWNHDGEETE